MRRRYYRVDGTCSAVDNTNIKEYSNVARLTSFKNGKTGLVSCVVQLKRATDQCVLERQVPECTVTAITGRVSDVIKDLQAEGEAWDLQIEPNKMAPRESKHGIDKSQLLVDCLELESVSAMMDHYEQSCRHDFVRMRHHLESYFRAHVDKRDGIQPEVKLNEWKLDPYYDPNKTNVIWGTTRIGKTRYVLDKYKAFLATADPRSFADYDPDVYKSVAWDDVDLLGVSCRIDTLKQMFDVQYSYNCRVLYGWKRIPAGTPRFIISNRDFEAELRKRYAEETKDDRDALFERFNFYPKQTKKLWLNEDETDVEFE